MLDSRPDLPLPPAAVPDFFQQDMAAGNSFPHARFLPGFKPSGPFSHRQGHQVQGGLSEYGAFLRNQPAHGRHALVRAVYNWHHFAHTDPKMSKPRQHIFHPVPHMDPTVAHLLGEKRTLCHRFSAHVAFPQAALAVSSAQDCVALTHCPRGYQSGQIHDVAKRNFMFGLESVSIARSVRSMDSLVPRKCPSSLSCDFAKRATPSQGQSGLYEKWWKSEQALALEQGSHRQPVSSFRERNAFSIQNVNSQLSSPLPVSSSPATPPSEGSSVSLTQPSPPQTAVSDLKEHCLRTSSGDACLQKLRKGPTHKERLYRPKRYKDSSLPNKRHPVMSSRSSLISKTHKNRKLKFPPRLDTQPSQSEAGHPVQEELRKVFHCSQCRYVTDRKNNLKRHVVTMHHKTSRVLECCGTIFQSKASLRDHVTLFHRGGYRCQVCGRNFCRKALLRRHLTVHSGQKDFACQLCGYATSHKSNLERHQRVHARKTTFFAHNLPFRHHQQEPANESARFTRGKTVDESNDMRNRHAFCGQAIVNNHQDQNPQLTERAAIENHETCHFSESRHRHFTSDAKLLCQQDGTPKNRNNGYTVSDILNTGTADKSEPAGRTITNCSDMHLIMNSNKTEVSDSPQLRGESERVSRDSTNIPSDVTSFPSESLLVHCSSSTEPESSALSPFPAVSSFSTSKSSGEKFDVKRTFCSSKDLCSRSWLLSRKVCFPNRLNETYHSADFEHASEILTPDTLCHDTELEEHGEDDTITVTGNVKENKVPPQDKQSPSLKTAPCGARDSCRNGLICSDDKGHGNGKNKLQHRSRMCNLLYRCYGCSACFAHQGELNDHVCQLQDGCLLDFSVTSSVKKGCIKLSPLDVGDIET